MTNVTLIQQKIYKGYGKAASKLGLTYQQYRPTTAITPINDDDLIGDIQASMTTNFNYMQFNKYGQACWIGLVDGRLTQVGDYLVGTSLTDDDSFFVGSMDSLMPIMMVSCNRTITIVRPYINSAIDADASEYQGFNPDTDVVLAQTVPVSILEGRKGPHNPVGLSSDTFMSMYKLLMPNLGLDLQTTDKITDDRGTQYVISSVERTAYGYRLSLHQKGA